MGKSLIATFLLLAGCRSGGPAGGLGAAAANNNVNRVNALLNAGADPNARGGHGITPLVSAARAGALDAIRALVKRGADPNLRCGVSGWTPLMHAIHKDQAGSVEALIGAGAEVNARGEGGRTPLMMAAGYGYDDILRLLIDRGADASAQLPDGKNALSFAILGVADIDRFTLGDCQIPTVRTLMRKAPDLKLQDSASIRRAIELAKIRGCAAVAKLTGQEIH
jgi:hypothetical protein